jgi:hypothetical protein
VAGGMRTLAGIETGRTLRVEDEMGWRFNVHWAAQE